MGHVNVTSGGRPTTRITRGESGKTRGRGAIKTTRAVLTLALALSSLLIVNASGVSAQTATPMPAPTPTPATTTTGSDSSTSTSTEVRSPTNTSTEAYTAGNVTVTGGAGDGDTTVNIYPGAQPEAPVRDPAAPSTIACGYKLGFAALHALIPAIAGDCLTDETYNPTNGDGWQDSAGGLMVWRKADNWTAFTDGYNTWINGPVGIQERLNTQRYSWEPNPDNLPVV